MTWEIDFHQPFLWPAMPWLLGLFVPSKKLIPKIERLFTVNVGFF